MLRTGTILCAAVLVGHAPGQVRFVAVSKHQLVVQAQTPRTAVFRQTYPANRTIPDNTRIVAYASYCSRSEATMSYSVSGNTLQFLNNASSRNRYPCGAATAKAGANAILVTLSATTPVAGRVEVDIHEGVDAVAEVDIGDDGSVEFDQHGKFGFDAVIGPGGLRVGLRGDAWTHPSRMGGSAIIKLRFVPGVGAFGVRGRPCRGVGLGSFRTARLIEFAASGIPAGRPALFAAGLRDPAVPLPPLGCRVHTDALAWVAATVTGGAARLRVPLGTTIPKGTFFVQLGTSTAGGWVTSNGVALTL